METTDEKRPLFASKEVPKRVIQIWLGNPPPPKIEKMMMVVRGVCHVAGWEYELIDDAFLGGFVVAMARRGRDDFARALARCCHVSQRSDVIRYWALACFGGLYLDADVDLWKLPEGFRGAWVWKSTDVSCNAAVLAAPAGDPFVRRLVDGLPGVELEKDMMAGPPYVTALVDSLDCPPVGLWATRAWAGAPGAFGHHLYMRGELGSHLKP